MPYINLEVLETNSIETMLSSLLVSYRRESGAFSLPRAEDPDGDGWFVFRGISHPQTSQFKVGIAGNMVVVGADNLSVIERLLGQKGISVNKKWLHTCYSSAGVVHFFERLKKKAAEQ
jgi:hypothetical protein